MSRKVLAIILFCCCLAATLPVIADGSDAESVTSWDVWGVSQNNGSAMKIAIDEDSTFSYESITWMVYIPTATNVSCDGLVDEYLESGLYRFDAIYDPGTKRTVIWTIGDDTTVFSLTIRSTIVNVDDSALYDQYPKGYLDTIISQTEKQTALICIVLALVSSFWIIPMCRYRKENTVEDVYDE